MYTYMLYYAQRPKTAQEQRELDTINGEIVLAIMRSFRRLRRSLLMARPVISFMRSDGGAAPSGPPRTAAAGVDVPPVSHSHDSLEDIYRGLVSQDQAAHRR